jgi:hypothetical protein
LKYPNNYFENKKRIALKESANKEFYFPYKLDSCANYSSSEQDSVTFLQDGLLGILNYFYQNEVSMSERFITSEAIFELLPKSIREYFYFYRFHLEESSSPKEKVIILNYDEHFTSVEDLCGLEFENAKLLFNFYKPIESFQNDNKLAQILNFLKSKKGLSFIDASFFKKNLSYSEYSLELYLDGYFNSFSKDYLKYINLGFKLKQSKPTTAKVISSHWINPLYRFDVLESDPEVSLLDKIENSREEFLRLNDFNQYYYIKKASCD